MTQREFAKLHHGTVNVHATVLQMHMCTKTQVLAFVHVNPCNQVQDAADDMTRGAMC